MQRLPIGLRNQVHAIPGWTIEQFVPGVYGLKTIHSLTIYVVGAVIFYCFALSPQGSQERLLVIPLGVVA